MSPWAVVVRRTASGPAVIEHLLERRSAFVRRAAGRVSAQQVVAVNVDTVFVVTSLDRDFNPRRVERYLAPVAQSGARAVVVLTKCDLVEDVDAFAEQIHHDHVIPVSAHGGVGLERLTSWTGPGQTVALVGSSGVGKSTLANALLGHELQVQLWEGVLDEVFDDIAGYAGGCAFRDCSHTNEPGCGVQDAIDDGRLTAERLASHDKLQRELAHEERRHSAKAQRDVGRNMAKRIKQAKAMRRSMGRRRSYAD
jgi:ribosome biogenesis GTPase